jgi:hypothetical protein
MYGPKVKTTPPIINWDLSPANGRGGSAIGGYGNGQPGAPASTYTPTMGAYQPPHGGSPFPYNPDTGGYGYNVGPGGYGQFMSPMGNMTPMGPAMPFQPRKPLPPTMQQMPTGSTPPSYNSRGMTGLMLPSMRRTR